MDCLIKGIEEDVMSIHSRSSTTDSSLSTLRGIGTLTGKALMIGGEFILKGVEKAIIRRKLSQIATKVKSSDHYIPHEFYQDLLELQRIGLYSKGVRHQAWDLLLLLMEKRRTERLIDAIREWPQIETQLLLRQLCVFKLSGWTLHPASFAQLPSKRPEPCRAIEVGDKAASWTFSFRAILSTTLKEHPQLIHTIFGTSEFVQLQLMPSTLTSTKVATDALPDFFRDLAIEHDPSSTESSLKWELPIFANDFIDFLNTGPIDHVKVVVDHVSSSLRAIAGSTSVGWISVPSTDSTIVKASGPSISERVKAAVTNQPPPVKEVPKPRLTHPAFSYIWFTAYLASMNPTALELLVEADILEHLEAIWLQGEEENVRKVTCVFLAVLSSRGVFPSLAKHLRTECTPWFLKVFPYFTADYSLLSKLQGRIRSVELPNDRDEFVLTLLELWSSGNTEEDTQYSCWRLAIGELMAKRVVHLAEALLRLPQDCAVLVLQNLVAIRILPPDHELVKKLFVQREDFGPDYFGGLRTLVEQIYKENQVLVHQSIDLGVLGILQTDIIIAPGMQPLFASYFSLFYASMEENDTQLLDGSELSRCSSYLKYMAKAPPNELQHLANHIIALLRSSSVARQEGDVVIRSWFSVDSLVQFAIHVAFESTEVSRLFINAGLPEVLDQIWLYPSIGEDNKTRRASHDSSKTATFPILRLLLNGVLGYHHRELLIPTLQQSRLQSWIIDPRVDIVFTQLCLRSTSGWFDLSGSLKSITETLGFPSLASALFSFPNGPRLDSSPWQELLSLFRSRSLTSSDTSETVVLEAANQIMLFCATHPESDWVGLYRQLQTCFDLGFFLDYMINDYFRCVRPPAPPSNRVADSLLRMYERTRWLKMKHQVFHPADVFLKLLSLMATGSSSSMKALAHTRWDIFVESLLAGTYDTLCGEKIILSQDQITERDRRCKNLKEELRIGAVYGDD